MFTTFAKLETEINQVMIMPTKSIGNVRSFAFCFGGVENIEKRYDRFLRREDFRV